MTKTIGRLLGLVLAAALLPSCRTERDEWVWVTVTNQGVVAVDIWSESESAWNSSTLDEIELSLGPNDSLRFRFRYENLGRLKVRIYRSDDHFKLFDDFWDRDDLDDLDQRVSITVSP